MLAYMDTPIENLQKLEYNLLTAFGTLFMSSIVKVAGLFMLFWKVKIRLLSWGGGAQKVSDPRFSHFVAPPPLPVINDQSLTTYL